MDYRILDIKKRITPVRDGNPFSVLIFILFCSRLKNE